MINNAKIVHGKDVIFRQIDLTEGYIKGELYCYAGFSLHIAEYVTITGGVYKKEKYRYQILNSSKKPIVRWDNAPHHSGMTNFPFHKHEIDGSVTPSSEISLSEIFQELYQIIDKNL